MLDDMNEADRSKHSGTVVMEKSSSECLIIKKKGADSAGGVSGFSHSSSTNLSRSSKEKKRRRFVVSDSESSDNSSETIRQKVDKFHNGSAVYNGAYSENREFQKEKKVSNGLDVFEFDEYDGFDDSRIRKSANNGSRPTYATSRFEMEDDEYDLHLPLSVFSEKQGKNGVLKVMVNKNKHSRKSYDQKEPNPRVVHKKKLDKNGDHIDAGDGLKFQEPKVAKSSKKINESDEVMKLKLYTRRKAVKNKAIKTKGKLSTVKHGSSSEKQILREKIKNMLLEAGWTIKYIPRKDKNYMDANYITPSGTIYWSIIKAYDALQNEEKDNNKDSGEFTPLRDEILHKLSKRQTQKKIKRKTKDKDTVSDEEDGRKIRKLSRCTLLVRDSKPKLENEFSLYSGKRTLLAWLIDSGVVHMNEDVEYMNPRRTHALQKGKITRDGIRCGCCNKIVTVLKFELHSRSKARNPYKNIFLKSGKSLIQVQIDAWNTLTDSERKGFFSVDVDGDDPNDDTCGLCGDGGDLICCDSCPSTFHQTCLAIQMLPEGDWHCPNCSCKYCGGGKNEASLLMCTLCCKKYHESCRPGIDVDLNEFSYLNLSFCGQKCHEVYRELQKLVGVKHELGSGFSWSLIHRSDSLRDASSDQVSGRVECNSMLAVAMIVMDECFLPVTDSRLGINLIRNVVFNCGSNLSRINYSGFYTAILERGDEVVSAASIRLHGTQLAEMPYIGTRHIYRRQGMCSRLLSAIESALSGLDVEKLIIPAVAEHMNTWTDVFGFHPLEDSHKQEIKSLNMVVFPGTDMLQKPLVKKGNNTVKVDDDGALLNKSELISSTITDSASQESGIPLDVNVSKETVPINSPVKDESPCESELQLPVKESDSDSKVDKIDVPNGNGTNPKEGSCGGETNRDGSSNVVDCNEKPAIIDSSSEELCVRLDDGCSLDATKDILPINSSVKDESPCESELHLTGKESDSLHSHSDSKVDNISVPNGNETPGEEAIKDNIRFSDSCESEMNRKEKERAIPEGVSDSEAGNDLKSRNMLEFPGTNISQKLLTPNAIPQGKKGNNAIEVDDKTTSADSGFQESGVSLNASKDSLPTNSPAKDESPCELPGKESDSIHSLSDSKVEETVVQNGNGSNPIPSHQFNDAIYSDVPSESHVQVQLLEKISDSIHSDSDFKVDKIAVQNGNFGSSLDASKDTHPIKDESLRESGMESDSIQSHSDSKIDKIAMQNGDGTPGKEPVKDHIRFSEEKKDSHESQINSKEKEKGKSDSKAENNLHSDAETGRV